MLAFVKTICLIIFTQNFYHLYTSKIEIGILLLWVVY